MIAKLNKCIYLFSGVPLPRRPGEPRPAPLPPGAPTADVRQRKVHLQVPRRVPAPAGKGKTIIKTIFVREI